MADPDPWAQFPTTQNAATLPNGGVYVPPTLTPAQQADDARANAAEGRQQAASTWTAMSPEEIASAGLPPGTVAQRNGLGEIKVLSQGDAAAQPYSQSAIDAFDRAISSGERLLVHPGLPAAVGSAFDPASFGVINPVTGKPLGGTEAANFMGELEAMKAQVFLPMVQSMKGMGQLSNAEGQKLTDAIGALDVSMGEDAFRASLQRIIADLTTYRDRGRPEGAEAPPPGPSAMRQGSGEPGVSGAAGAYMTPRDKELQDKLRAAYSAGASLTELQAIAAEYGTPVGLPATQAELDKARAEGRQINVTPSGFREEDVSALGISADSRSGAYAMSAANALLSGGLDEIVGALGGDAAMAQAAKDQMRDRYPGASFAGEVTGQALQLAAGGAALRGAGAGARTMIGAEAAQGAAYGAGESNENRLLGAAVGAGGALAGRAIADRFVEPGVQAVFQKISRDTGVPVEEVQRVAAEALETSTTEATEAVAEPISDEVTRLARQAAGSGLNPRSRTARRKLAEIAAVNAEAAAAAQRLGVDLPPDVLSENLQLRNLTGLARSQVGSEAETGWQSTAGRAALRVQNVLEEVGATNDLAQLSENVGARITATMNDLKSQADALRTEVDEVISPSAAMDAPALRARLTQTVDELGGAERAAEALNPLERRLMRLIDDENPPTYAYFERIRRDIGAALEKGKGPFADIDQRTLGEYYAALKSDRLDFVRTVAGDEMADKMAASNALYSQMYDARGELIDLFGKNLEGGIVPQLRTALTTGTKGDIKTLNRILARIPEDMQGEVLLSGIMAESMSKTGANGGFSFTNFSKLYRGLQNNKPIIAKIGRAIGPERMAIMSDLYAVGRRIADAESRIIRTGKANQAQLATLNADSFVSSFLKQWGTRAAGAGAGAMTGTGPLGMATGATVGEVLTRLFTSGTTRTDRLHNVLSSPQFRDTVERVAAGDTSPGVMNKLANSNAFVAFARATGLDTPEARMAWLKRIATGTGTAGATAAVAETEPQPRIELVP